MLTDIVQDALSALCALIFATLAAKMWLLQASRTKFASMKSMRVKSFHLRKRTAGGRANNKTVGRGISRVGKSNVPEETLLSGGVMFTVDLKPIGKLQRDRGAGEGGV